MTSAEYWQKREDEALKRRIKEEAEYDKEIEKIYRNMLDQCQKEIESFYTRYAKREGISLAEAKKRVSKLDIERYERKAEKYVKEKDFSKEANEEMRLYNLTMKVNRLEMLKANIGLEVIAGTDELEKFMAEILQERTEDELKRQAGILGKTIVNNAKKAHSIVNASFHNATFSTRLWANSSALTADLGKLIQSGMIAGKNPRAICKDLEKHFVGEPKLKNGRSGAQFSAERLMRTELARVQTEAQKAVYLEEGIEEYEFMPLHNCCDICREVAKKHNGIYKVKDMQAGENAPPLHPLCRCTTAGHVDRSKFDAWLDYVSNGGTDEYEAWLLNLKRNGSSGAKFPNMEKYMKKFSKNSAPCGIMEALKRTNPNYSEDRIEYSDNCQRCVVAYEMLRRGYNAVAKPILSALDPIKEDYTLPWKKAKKINCPNGDDKATIEKKMKEFGDGARCIVRVNWDGYDEGHVFVAEQVDGKTIFIDPQTGKSGVEYYFEFATKGATTFIRVDNLDVTAYVKDCCEVVE